MAERAKAILQQQAIEDTDAIYAIRREREVIQRLHHNAQRLLQTNLDVRVPFSESIQFPSDMIRARRDRGKLIELTKAIAFLSQFQREIKHGPHGEKFIEATAADYTLAYSIAKQTFVDTLDDLDKRARDEH